MDHPARASAYSRRETFSARLKDAYTSSGVDFKAGAGDIEADKQFCGKHELIFIGDLDPRKPMSENTVNSALRVMGYDTKVEVCGHGFRTMACSSLIESGLWPKDAVERQMSHMERNSVRAAYIHKAEHLDERKLMLQWWADFLDANREKGITPFDYAKVNRGNV